MYREILDLESSILTLQAAVTASKGALNLLAAARHSLQTDVDKKTHALYVDQVKVMNLRNTDDVGKF